MRSTLLLAAAMLAAMPAAAQQHTGSTASAVEIDPCTGKPVETASTGAGDAASGTAGTAHATHPAGSHADAQGTAQANPGAASAASSASHGGTAASSTFAGGHGTTQPNPGSASSAAAWGAAAASTSDSGPGMTSASSASGSVISPTGTPGTAASSTSAGGQGMTSSASADGPETPARDADPRRASRNRASMRLGLGRMGDQVRLGPAASVSVPTALGVDAGEVFFGMAYQGRTRYTRQDDAAAVVGFGIGTRRVLALEAALTTYSTFRGAPFETGGVSFKLHRTLPGHSSIAVGYENALLWGGSDDDGSLYAVASRQLNLRGDPGAPFSTAVATLGVGNGRFRFEEDYAAGRETVNVFGALGVRVTGPLSLVADWTGQDLNAAASLTPVPRLPLVVTVGLADLTGSAGDGVRPIVSLGYGLAVRQPF